MRINNRRFIFLLLTMILSNSILEAQKLKTRIFDNDTSLIIPLNILPSVSNDSLIRYYDNLGKKGSYVIAKMFDLNVTTSNGMWIKNNDNTLTWVIEFQSKTAYSLNFVIENIDLPNNTQLYVINKDNGIINGPYTKKSINEDSTLYVEQIPGDNAILELDLPINTDTNKNYFTVKKVGHDFRDFFRVNTYKRALGGSGSCEHDINCGIGLDWQKEKHSVVYYSYIDPIKGLSTCTGTLINNTANNELPYILAANHCIKDAKTASTAIFYFNYENSSCGSSDGKLTQSISGATLVATSKDSTADLDFTLLKLKKVVPSTYNPFYAGWSIKTNIENNVVALHHPKGDALKISFSKDNILNSSYTYNGYMANSHWQIATWDTGVTEEGSSGCALYNSNHEIIGTLTGGDSDCKITYNVHNDFFAKFYKSWDYFSDSTNQLKYWLDPLKLGMTQCSSYDPLVGSDNPVTNVKYDEELVTYNFGAKAKGGWTGYSQPKLIQCADKFLGIKNQNIYAIKFPIQLFNKIVDVSKVKLKVWSGIEKPDSLLFEQNLIKDSIISNQFYCFRLSNHIKAGSNFFVGFDLTNLLNSDSLFLYTVKNRTNGSNSLYFDYKNQWVQASDLGLNSSLGLEVYVTDNITPARKTEKQPEKLITIDTDSLISLVTKELFHTDSISNYDNNSWLLLHKYTDDKGFWTGSNQNGINEFAEKYTDTTAIYISGIKLAVAKNTITNINTKINLSIVSDAQFPDSVIYSFDINANELKPNYYNVFKFNDFITIDSSIDIVLNMHNVEYPDTFALYMGNPTNNSNKYNKHSFFKNNIGWLNYYMYDIHENIGLSLETQYGPYVYDSLVHNYSYKITNEIKPSDIVFKSFFIYPNPSSKAAQDVTLNFGNYFSKNITIVIYDIFGRIVSTPTPNIEINNSALISTNNLSPGAYFVKVTIDNQIFKPVTLIILR